jgi:hypothetical protein
VTELVEEQIIWFPGIYSGREGAYAKPIADVSTELLVDLVQKRAKEDGEWAIENGHVGGNEPLMREMMKWVSDPKNITQCADANPDETVDWVCRDLANGSKWIARGGASDG